MEEGRGVSRTHGGHPRTRPATPPAFVCGSSAFRAFVPIAHLTAEDDLSISQIDRHPGPRNFQEEPLHQECCKLANAPDRDLDSKHFGHVELLQSLCNTSRHHDENLPELHLQPTDDLKHLKMVRHSYERMNIRPKMLIGDDNSFEGNFLESAEILNGNTEDRTLQPDNLTSIYQGEWPLNRVLWNSAPSSIGEKGSLSGLLALDTSSMISFSSSISAATTCRRINTHHLGTKVEMVYSLLSLLGTHNKEEMSKNLLLMSKSPDSCIAMRQSGCLPLLVQLLHGSDESGKEVRARAGAALHNIVHAHADDKRGRRETRVLRLLEQIREYCDRLGSDQQNQTAEDREQHPGQAIAVLMKLSFDEEHRNAMCQLGGLYAIAELIEVDNEVHGNTSEQFNITLRRYGGMTLTNLTFGDGTNKALLCSMRPFMHALVGQLSSPNEDLRQVTASVLRNLSWRADSSSKQILKEVGAVTTLMSAAMEAHKESTLKSILSALWNLSAHCSGNKADICGVPGALAFLVDTLNYKSPAIVENGGGILRNISSHVAVHQEHRRVLRECGCLQILLQHLRSSSLTVVSNACGTLWNLSARCDQDQALLWEMGAVPMLRNLVHSKHKMISMGSSAALKNLLSSKPAGMAVSQRISQTSNPDGTPTLLVRKQKALEEELDQSLAETCDNIDSPKTSPTRTFHPSESRYPPPYFTYLPGRMYHSVNGHEVPRSESWESVGSTRSEPPYPHSRKAFYHNFSRNGAANTPDHRFRRHHGHQRAITLDIESVLGPTLDREKLKQRPKTASSSSPIQDEPIDYSCRYGEGAPYGIKNSSPSVPKVNNYFPERQSVAYSDASPWQQNGRKMSTLDGGTFGSYTETDLDDPDQPTDYSQKYTEKMDTSDYEPNDTVKVYHTEGTPLTFSTASSLSDLRDPSCATPKPTKVFIPVLADCDRKKTSQEVNDAKKTDKRNEGVAVKSVTFGEEVNYAVETPLMFSRCSSLGSLSSFDQHSIHDDRSSVISDFSRRASEVVSPSDLPDSPSQTMPTSPRRVPKQQPAFVFGNTSHHHGEDFSGGGDSCKVYAVEGTPANPSSAASLLSLCIDEEPSEEEEFFHQNRDAPPPPKNTSKKLPLAAEQPSSLVQPSRDFHNASQKRSLFGEDSIIVFQTEGTPSLLSNAVSLSELSSLSGLEPIQSSAEGSSEADEDHISSSKIGKILSSRPSALRKPSQVKKIVPPSENGCKQSTQNSIETACNDNAPTDEELIEGCIQLGRPSKIPTTFASVAKKSPKKEETPIKEPPKIVPRRAVATHACGFAHGSSYAARQHRHRPSRDDRKIHQMPPAQEMHKAGYSRMTMSESRQTEDPQSRRVAQLSRSVDSTREVKSSYQMEGTPVCFSRNSSLSSLSIESEGETSAYDRALLENCISLGKPKKQETPSQKSRTDTAEGTPNFSSSLSSLSVESGDEPSPYERALLQECIDMGKPKQKDNRFQCSMIPVPRSRGSSRMQADGDEDDEREEKGKEDERTKEKEQDEMMLVVTLEPGNTKVFMTSPPDDSISESTQLRLEAKKVLDKLEADDEHSEQQSISFSELDNVKPPSIMGDIMCLSMASSNGFSDSYSERHPAKRNGKSISSDLLDNVDLPSATFDLPRTASCTSLNSIGSDILENKSSSEIFERLDAAATIVNIYSRELSNIMNGGGNSVSDAIDRILPPSAFADLVTVDDFTDTIASDTEMDDLPKDPWTKDETVTSATPRAISQLRKSEADGSTENVCTLAEDNDPVQEEEEIKIMSFDEMASLQREANLVVTRLHQMAEDGLMLEDETMSLISNESDLEQEEDDDEEDKDPNGNAPPPPMARIVKPINRDAIRAVRAKQANATITKGGVQQMKQPSVVRQLSSPSKHVKPASRVPSTNQRKSINLLAKDEKRSVENDRKPNSSRLGFGTFTRSKDKPVAENLPVIESPSPKKTPDPLDEENRPKPPIKQRTFTKDSPTHTASPSPTGGSPQRLVEERSIQGQGKTMTRCHTGESLSGSRSASNISLASSSSAGKKSSKKEVPSRIAVLWKNKKPAPSVGGGKIKRAVSTGPRTSKVAVLSPGFQGPAGKRCESA